jgi:nucleoside-diphosphate-sugar epimerase
MKIALVGATGFLGNEFRDHLQGSGHQLLSFSRSCPDPFENESVIEAAVDERFPLEKLLDQDLVLYCAGSGVQSGSVVDNTEVYLVNTYFPIKLAEYLAQRVFTGTLVTFGSYFEIGNNAVSRQFREGEIIFASAEVPNAYCISKRLLTKYVHDSRSKFRHLHFILPTIYGERENPNRLIPYMVNCLGNRHALSLTAANQVRQYLYVRDLVAMVMDLTEQLAPGIYNVPSAITITIRELATKVAAYFEVSLNESSFNAVARADTAMRDLQMDASALRQSIPDFRFTRLDDVIPRYQYELQKL